MNQLFSGGSPESSRTLQGFVVLNPQTGIGATTGRLFVDRDTPIHIRQVPDPFDRGVPLADVDRQRAALRGRFDFDGVQVIFIVTGVFPLVRG